MKGEEIQGFVKSGLSHSSMIRQEAIYVSGITALRNLPEMR
jgi:hypothetical protein